MVAADEEGRRQAMKVWLCWRRTHSSPDTSTVASCVPKLSPRRWRTLCSMLTVLVVLEVLKALRVLEVLRALRALKVL